MRIFTRFGIKLEALQYPAFSKPTETLPLPRELTIPLAQTGCAPCYPAHPAGEHVDAGEALGFPEEDGCPVLSPASGTILSVEQRKHPLLGDVPCCVLRTDPQEGSSAARFSLPSGRDVLSVAREAQIVDELDGLPLYIKLEALRHNKKGCVFGAALEEDVYPSSGCACLAESPDEIGKGLRLAAQAVGADDFGLLAVSSARVLRHLPPEADGIPISRYTMRYPARAVAEEILGLEPDCLIGVQALLALSRAAAAGDVQTSFVVTVAGDCVDKPRNVRVAAGTPVSALLAHCELNRQDCTVILGSVMTGCEASMETPVFPGIRSVIALSQAVSKRETACIECGRCVRCCPKGLLPFYTFRAAGRGDYALASRLRPQDCIHCLACNYLCPAGIDVSQAMRQVENTLLVHGERRDVSHE